MKYDLHKKAKVNSEWVEGGEGGGDGLREGGDDLREGGSGGGRDGGRVGLG